MTLKLETIFLFSALLFAFGMGVLFSFTVGIGSHASRDHLREWEVERAFLAAGWTAAAEREVAACVLDGGTRAACIQRFWARGR